LYCRKKVNICTKKLNMWAMEDHPEHRYSYWSTMGQKYYLQLQEAGTYFTTAESMIHTKFSIASHVVVYFYINVYINQTVLWEKKLRRKAQKNNVGCGCQTRGKQCHCIRERRDEDKKGFTILPKSFRKPTSSELSKYEP
jgi:hypothetical protein